MRKPYIQIIRTIFTRIMLQRNMWPIKNEYCLLEQSLHTQKLMQQQLPAYSNVSNVTLTQKKLGKRQHLFKMESIFS